MRHPHYASTPADYGRTGSARQSLERPIDQAGQMPQWNPSTPSATTESRLEYTFSGGYAENPILIGAEQIAAYRRRCEVPPVEDSGESEWERARGIPDLVGEYMARRKGRRAGSR